VTPRRGGVVVPSLAAGVLLAFSLPPWGFWPLGLLGAGLFYWRLAGLGVRARLLSGWTTGLGCYAIGLSWAAHFNWYGAVILVVLESLSLGLAGVLTPPGRGRLLGFIGACTALEAVRSAWPFGGLPLGGIDLGQVDGPLLALARLGGPLLLAAGVWTGGAVCGSLVPLCFHRTTARQATSSAPARVRVGWAPLVAAAGLIGLTLVAAVAPDGGPPVGWVAVAAVQGGGRRGVPDTEVAPASVFDAQVAASDRLGRRAGAPELVLWPEDVVALSGPLAGSAQAAYLSSLARRLHATVAAGVTEIVSPTSFRNEIVAWGPNGAVVSVFEKVHRVPFGEYVPFRHFFSHLANLSAVPLDAVAGHGSGLMRTPAAPLGALVSYEVFFASRGRSSVRAGAELLIVPTNTSSYSTSQVPGQELAAARLQAVAEGRDLVQASPTGYSAVVSNGGSVLERSGLSVAAVVSGRVPLRRSSTVYTDLGDLPILALALVSIALGFLVARRRTPATEAEPVA
jgi:apolipoprotein N-acyltransferase